MRFQSRGGWPPLWITNSPVVEGTADWSASKAVSVRQVPHTSTILSFGQSQWKPASSSAKHPPRFNSRRDEAERVRVLRGSMDKFRVKMFSNIRFMDCRHMHIPTFFQFWIIAIGILHYGFAMQDKKVRFSHIRNTSLKGESSPPTLLVWQRSHL